MRSIDEIMQAVEACRSGNCRACPYMAAAEVCSDQLGLDMIELLHQVGRENLSALVTMAEGPALNLNRAELVPCSAGMEKEAA